MKSSIQKSFGVSIIVGVISACFATPTPVQVSPTITEALPTTIASQTLQPIEVPTRTPQLPAATVIPTLGVEDATTEINRLVSDRNACPFPCWWGLVPGKTRISDAQNFLNGFRALSVGSPVFRTRSGSIDLSIYQSDNSYIYISTYFKGDSEIIDWLTVELQNQNQITDPDGTVRYETSWSDPQLAEITDQYSLPQILEKYGMPSEVLIHTHQATLINQPWLISLVVFYPETGLMIEYVTVGKGAPESSIAWCPTLAYPIFWFWSPSIEISLPDVVRVMPTERLNTDNLSSGKFKSLDEATDLSVEEFFSLYQSDENACIPTPTRLWPMPGQ